MIQDQINKIWNEKNFSHSNWKRGHPKLKDGMINIYYEKSILTHTFPGYIAKAIKTTFYTIIFKCIMIFSSILLGFFRGYILISHWKMIKRTTFTCKPLQILHMKWKLRLIAATCMMWNWPPRFYSSKTIDGIGPFYTVWLLFFLFQTEQKCLPSKFAFKTQICNNRYTRKILFRRRMEFYLQVCTKTNKNGKNWLQF
jgi:hypothetical protein